MALEKTGPLENKEPRVSSGLGLPLHRQLSLILSDQIQSGRYGAGELLPTEDELRRRFGVSRITVRSALATLEANGLIYRRHGSGTYVRPGFTRAPLRVGIREELAHMEEQSRRTTIRLIDIDVREPPPHVSGWFGCDPRTKFLHIARLRVAAQPILLLVTYIPEVIGRQFSHEELATEPHYELMQRIGLGVSSGEQLIGATLADPSVASLLEVEIGAPLLRIRQLYSDNDMRPVRYLELLASPNQFELHLALDGSHPQRN